GFFLWCRCACSLSWNLAIFFGFRFSLGTQFSQKLSLDFLCCRNKLFVNSFITRFRIFCFNVLLYLNREIADRNSSKVNRTARPEKEAHIVKFQVIFEHELYLLNSLCLPFVAPFRQLIGTPYIDVVFSLIK